MSLTEVDAALTAPGAPFEMRKLDGDPTIRVWDAFPNTIVDLLKFVAERHAQREALVLDDIRLRYRDLIAASCALAEHLSASGLKPGDHLAIAMRNCVEWPVAFFGAALAGAVIVPLNSWWTGEELRYALDDCGARYLIVDAERARRIGPKADAAQAWVVGDGSTGSGFVSLAGAIGAPTEWSLCDSAPVLSSTARPQDDLAILYTSGTSGRPKGAIASHANILSCIGSMRYLAARAALRADLPLPSFDPKVCLLTVPLFHVTALAANLLPQLYTGSKVVLMDRWDASAALGLIERERVTVAGGVPTIVLDLLNHPRRAECDLSSLEVLTYGGAAAPDTLPARVVGEACAAPGNGWGMTETSATVTGHFGTDYVMRPLSAGPPVPVYDLRIVKDGIDVPPERVGELWVRGPGVVRGYWKQPEATAQTFADGWLRTGDLAYLDQDGFLYVIDRLKDVIIRGGENIYSVEVENALKRVGGILDAAVVGLPDGLLGEVPATLLQVADANAFDAEQLQEQLAVGLARYKIPIHFFVQRNPLQRNANGKLIKGEIRDQILTMMRGGDG